MRPIWENTVIQIEITNACHLSCRNCTRHVGHHRKPFFMDLDYFKRAVESVLQSPCRIGIMGGEPCLHPQFRDVLAMYADMVPIERREFWTAAFRWSEYEGLIKETFWPERIAYNDHQAYDGMHAPLLVAIDEVVEDPELRRILIENCPYQSHWSASITPRGGFFCEIAASLDWLFDGPGGYDISDPRWWDKSPAEFQDQVSRYCGSCSGAIPLPSESDGRGGRDGPTDEWVSPGNLKRLMEVRSPKIQKGAYRVFRGMLDEQQLAATCGHNPREYRSFEAHSPEDVAKALAKR